MIDELDLFHLEASEEEFKDVFSQLGSAIYLAQSIEHNIVTMTLVLDFLPKGLSNFKDKEAWDSEFSRYQESAWTKTLGRLIGTLREVISRDDEVFEMLNKCLKRRNWLVHGFMRDRAVTIMTSEGRKSTILELDADKELFARAVDVLMDRLIVVLEGHGCSKDMVLGMINGLLSSGSIK